MGSASTTLKRTDCLFRVPALLASNVRYGYSFASAWDTGAGRSRGLNLPIASLTAVRVARAPGHRTAIVALIGQPIVNVLSPTTHPAHPTFVSAGMTPI